MLHNFRRSLRERGKKEIIVYGRPSYAAEINRMDYFTSKRKNENSELAILRFYQLRKGVVNPVS